MAEDIQEKPAELPKDVAKKYEITGGLPIGKIRVSPQFGGREFDLQKISVAEADKLYASKFPHIKLTEAYVKEQAEAEAKAKAAEKAASKAEDKK